jgi:hippurate hydrolase
MTHPIIEALQVNEAQFIALRRRFHQQPEIGLKSIKPAKRSPACWRMGLQVHRGLAGTGVVGTLRVGEGKKRLGLRADMDALPMQEMSGKPWASRVDGRFHGCGHDGPYHHAILRRGISGAHPAV